MEKYLRLKVILVCMVMFLGALTPVLADVTPDVEPDSGDGNIGDVYIPDGAEVRDIGDIVDGMPQSSDTDLTTVVPATISVYIIGVGSVSNGNNVYSSDSSFKTTDTTFKMIPGKGYQISKVYWNGVDVTAKIKNGVLRLSDIESGILKVKFVVIPAKDKDKKEEKGNCCCPKCERGCNCQGKCKCKACCCVNTSDDVHMAYYFVMAMLISVIVFILTLTKTRVCLKSGREYRYAKVEDGNGCGELKK